MPPNSSDKYRIRGFGHLVNVSYINIFLQKCLALLPPNLTRLLRVCQAARGADTEFVHASRPTNCTCTARRRWSTAIKAGWFGVRVAAVTGSSVSGVGRSCGRTTSTYIDGQPTAGAALFNDPAASFPLGKQQVVATDGRRFTQH